MSDTAPGPTPRWRFGWIQAAHVLCLSAFAFAQPLYDLLGSQATFFVASRAEPVDLWLFVLLLSVVLPLVWMVPCLVLGRVAPKAGRAWYLGTLGLLVTITVLPLVARTGLPDAVIVAVALAAACLAVFAYTRAEPVRSFVSLLALAALVFPVRFLIRPEISALMFPSGPATGAAAGKGAKPIPVVMVVFDEFPLVTLLDSNLELDRERYPNFGRLADKAWWFRQATSVADGTVDAVPAILSGRFPEERNVAPLDTFFPNNLFTLLSPTHDIHAEEAITALCPEHVCRRDPLPIRARLTALLRDASIIFLHWSSPPMVRSHLPDVSSRWAGFGETDRQEHVDEARSEALARALGERANGDRTGTFHAFVDAIRKGERPTLHFLHILLPHLPHVYLPSGKRYDESGFRGFIDGRDVLSDDSGILDLAERRGLLQIQHVDRLLGELIDHLETEGLFDDALIVVVSDHGFSNAPGGHRRALTADNHAGILSIPLLVKLPGQQAPVVSDVNAQSIDVLPTIADALGAEVTWPVDGRSLLSGAEGPKTKRAKKRSAGKLLEFAYPIPLQKAAAQYLARFAHGDDLRPLYAVAGAHELVGTRVDQWPIEPSASGSYEVANAARFGDVSLSAETLPVDVTGQIWDLPSEFHRVAVAVNGTIGAVEKVFQRSGGGQAFEALVSDHLLREGHNEVALYGLRESEGGPVLMRLSTAAGSFALETDGEVQSVISPGGRIPVDARAIESYIDKVDLTAEGVVIRGWAAPVSQRVPPDRILAFSRGKLVTATSSFSRRPDVANHFGVPEVMDSGFALYFPWEQWRQIRDGDLVLLVTEGTVASPLRFPAHSRCVFEAAIGIADFQTASALDTCQVAQR